MSRGFELSSDLLTSQGRALRGLARSLLGDPQAADDVVQETWLACLRHPTAMPERLSAWLGTVARRLALRRLRGEERRDRRERRAAVPERLEDAAQRSLEREEALRAVTAALLALEEPFKTALFLRYFEDRAPQAIADELGLPLATVKSRLARGLEKLRARLGAGRGEAERLRGLAALAGLGARELATAGTATAASSAALGPAALALAAASLTLAAGALWWGRASPEPRAEAAALVQASEEPRAGLVAAAAGAADAAAGAPAQAEDGSGREAAAPSASEPARVEVFPPEASFSFRIAGRVRDAQDQPLEGARVYLAPRLFPFNQAATTDAQGHFEIAFDGRRGRMRLLLGFAKPGHATILREVELVAGLELAVDVGLRSASETWSVGKELQISADQDSTGEVLYVTDGTGGAESKPLLAFLAHGTIDSHWRGLTSTSRLEQAPSMVERVDGRRLFVAPAPEQGCEARFLPAEALRLARVERTGLEGLVLPELLVQAAAGIPIGPPEPAATVHGSVRDALGGPLAGVVVGWGAPGQAPSATTHSAADGSFTLAGLPPGELALHAGGGDDGRAAERVTLAAGGELAWNPVLERGAEVRGRLVAGGEPLAGARVELWSASAGLLWSDATRADEDGRFALPNVPSGALELHVVPAGAGACFPARVVAPVFAGSELGTLDLAATELATRALLVRVLDHADEAAPGIEVRVVQASTGLARLAAAAGEPGAFEVPALPGGAYRVEAGGALGWRDLGSLWIDPAVAGALDLGTLRLAEPGRLAVTPEERGLGLALWSAHPDVFGRVATLEGDGVQVLGLAAGEYVLCAERGARARCETPVSIASGAASALALVSPAADELVARPAALPPLETTQRCSACHAPSAVGRSVELREAVLEAF